MSLSDHLKGVLLGSASESAKQRIFFRGETALSATRHRELDSTRIYSARFTDQLALDVVSHPEASELLFCPQSVSGVCGFN